MILYVPPNAPLLVKAGADLLLAAHIGGGSVGIVSGFTAFLTRKGGRIHRTAGDIFVISMLVMGAIGAAVSPFLPTPQPGNITGGVLTCYLVATGWATARRRDGRIGQAQSAAIAVPLVMVPTLVWFGLLVYQAPGHAVAGVPFVAPLVMAVLAAFMAAADLNAIVRRVLTPSQRLARHLWRMGTGLLIATSSALTQPRIMSLVPAPLQSAAVMLAPILLIVGLMVYGLVRVSRLPTRPSPLFVEATA